MMEDWSGMYLLAEVCVQELRDLSAALVPVDFLKKKRSNLIKNKTETTGLKLKVSPTVLGKRCFFQLHHGHGSSDNGVDCKAKKMKHSVNANSFASSSSNSSALLNHGHGNGDDGDYYIGKMKQSFTATSAAFDSFASSSSDGVDGHCHGVCEDDDYKGNQKQRVTFSLSTVDGNDYEGKKKKRVTFCLSSSSCSTVTSVDYLGTKTKKQNITATASLQEETGPSKPSSSSCLNPPLPQFQLNFVCPKLPRAFMDRIQQMGGSEVMIVIEKTLFKSDLDKCLNRLSMPCIQIKNEFLKEEEKMKLCRKQNDGKHIQGMVVSVIEPCLDMTTLCLKKWDFNSTSSYVLIKNWINVADKNQLMCKMKVHLWSFRVNTALCFALVNLSRQRSTTLTS